MNKLYVILSVLVICIGFVKCNFTAPLSAVRAAANCYSCSNCPQPFNPYSPFVSQPYSNTGWCAMMSTSSSAYAAYTLGVAQPGLCTYNGCTWQYVGGVYTYVCCCNGNLCNAGPQQTTTIRPVSTTCFSCSNCPRPFDRYSSTVSQQYSSTGWCAKMGLSSSIDGIYTRGPAQPGLCTYNSCTWQYVNGIYTYVCCCTGYLCNTGVLTSQSIVAVLGAALMTTVLACKSF